MQIFRQRRVGPITWFAKTRDQSNHYCLYCGGFVGPGSTVASDKEHLIGRNFVPPGTLEGREFNFLFRSSCDCNRRKADAERHVSTVTLFSSPARASHPNIDEVARHKASRDFHPTVKGKPVSDALTKDTIEGGFGGATFRFGLTGPPQLDPTAVSLLACNQVQALFALVTSSDPRDPRQSRLLPARNWRLFGAFGYSDWGNPQVRELAERVLDWPAPALVVTAKGFFKAVLRRSEDDADGWFWALEWNQYLRVLGAIWYPRGIPPVFRNLPQLEWRPLPNGTGRYRTETPLAPPDDKVFDPSCN